MNSKFNIDTSKKIYTPRKKYFICGIIIIFIFFLLIFTNFSYLKIHPFEKYILIKCLPNISSSTIPTLTSTSITTTTDINEILCNNITNSNNFNITHNPCEQIRCAVILRKSGGRLGNRMFMFASAYGLARIHNCRLFISRRITGELSYNFQMISFKENMWLSEEDVLTMNDIIIKDTICNFIPDLLRPNAFKHIELIGYWQSYLYFDVYRDEIREIFSGRLNTLNKLSKYFFNITKNDCQSCLIFPYTSQNELRQALYKTSNITWIGIHIRRADFHLLGYSSDENYIFYAIRYFKRRYYSHQIRFLVSSDDKLYCEKLLQEEIKSNQIILLPQSFSEIDDLIALSLCHHSIVTGGTYGFWAGYLAGGEVVHDIRYPTSCTQSEYYPPWFLLAGKTKEQKYNFQ